MFIGNIPGLNGRLLSGIWLQVIFWLSYFHIIFSLFFRFFSEFFLFLFRKDLLVWFSVEFKVLCPFWCLFSRSDCHTLRNYLRSHLGLRSTKIFLWVVTLQFGREIGQIENQVPKREKHLKKIEKREKILYYEDRQKITRCRSEVNLWGQVLFQWSWKLENCSFNAKKGLIVIFSVLWTFFDAMESVSVN